jgi:hypothetical protein
MVIAAIAYRELSKEKQKAFIELLKSHPAYDTWIATQPENLPDGDLGLYLFMKASTWPDAIRAYRGDPNYEPYIHSQWHFIDAPLDATGPNPDRLPQEPENILKGIEQCEALLSDASKSLKERAIYLSWLIHLIGDVHQPLHCATMVTANYPKGDAGGNRVVVKVPDESRVTNLHAIWDSLLGGTPDDLGDVVLAINTISSIPNLSISDLRSGTTVKEWQEQSLLIAFETAYLSGMLPVRSREDPASLPANYIDAAKSVANKRATVAGLRLANTLKDLKTHVADEGSKIQVPDDAAKASRLGRLLQAIKEHQSFFSVTTIAILLMIFLSTRLISILLKLDLWGLKQIAPAFYLFVPLGRWKLYRRYRKRLRTGAGLTKDLSHGVTHYIDLPFTSDRPIRTDVRLSDVFATLRLDQRVIVEAEGGRGKSTLCQYLARRCVERRDLFGGKLLEPVVVDGLTYTGDMVAAITSALRKDRAYVNKTIVESQLAAGNLLVIFEGFSEIREAYLKPPASTDLPKFIADNPNTPFMITTRTSLPAELQQAMVEPLTIRLCDLDATTERTFLSNCLERGEEQVESLIKHIKERFNDLPRIPLMLKLVAVIYEESGEVPKNTAELFSRYTEKLLRDEATGIKHTTGLHYAVNYLVSQTYLRSGGDRGFTENRGVELLREIKDDLEARNIKLSPLDLLDVLKRAGLYKRAGRRLKFFHDSFESYFAARALESDFSDGKYEMLLRCVGNERLAEPWRFLNEMLDAPEDKQQLETLLRQQAEELAQAAYLKAQRDPDVDCYLHLVRQGNKYGGELIASSETQSIQVDLGQEELGELVKEIRRELVTTAQGVGLDAAEAQHHFNDCLPHLARLGYYAFQQIFKQRGFFEKLQEQILRKQILSIQIATDSFFFPWELLYPVNPADNLNYENFWGLNYEISRLIVQNLRHQPAGAKGCRSNGRPVVGAFFDRRFDDVRNQEIPFFLKLKDAGKLDLFELIPSSEMLNGPEILKTFKDFFARDFDLIHFACHTSYEESFAANSRINITDNLYLKLIEIESQDMAISGSPLIVINGSDGGNLDPLRPSGFAATFLKYGALAVIATQSVMSSITATAFTQELYTRLLAGDTLGTSLLEARKAVWSKCRNPMVLSYSLYGPPSFRLIQPHR